MIDEHDSTFAPASAPAPAPNIEPKNTINISESSMMKTKEEQKITNLETHVKVLERKLDNLKTLNDMNEQLAWKARSSEQKVHADYTRAKLELQQTMEKLDTMERKVQMKNLESSCSLLEYELKEKEKYIKEMEWDMTTFGCSSSTRSSSNTTTTTTRMIHDSNSKPMKSDKRIQLKHLREKTGKLRELYNGQKRLLADLIQKQTIVSQLMTAAAQGDLSTVQSLVARGVSVNTADETGICAFKYACGSSLSPPPPSSSSSSSCSHRRRRHRSQEQKREEEEDDDDDETEKTSEEIVRTMIPYADVNNMEGGLSPFHYAIKHKKLGVMRILLQHGANVDEPYASSGGTSTSTHTRTTRNTHSTCRGRGKSKCNENGESRGQGQGRERPIHVACKYGNVDMVKLMIEYGANIDHVDENGDCCLHYCARGGRMMMMNDGDDDNNNMIPIRMASLLLENGAQCCDVRNLDGLTPLTIARTQQNRGVMELLKAMMQQSD